MRSPKVSFYSPAEDQSEHTALALGVKLISDFFAEQKKIYVHASNKEQAEQLDEALWARDPLAFIPHRLVNELPGTPSPIIIGYDDSKPESAEVLINLSSKTSIPDFFRRYAKVIELVPNDETEKAAARERFKRYRAQGCQLSHETLGN